MNRAIRLVFADLCWSAPFAGLALALAVMFAVGLPFRLRLLPTPPPEAPAEPVKWQNALQERCVKRAVEAWAYERWVREGRSGSIQEYYLDLYRAILDYRQRYRQHYDAMLDYRQYYGAMLDKCFHLQMAPAD